MASRRISGRGSFSFSDQRRHGVLGRRSDLPQHQARPVGRLFVLQGFDQAGHGLGAGFGNRVQDAHPHARVGILQQLDTQRHGDLRAGANGHHGLDDLPADRFVGVFHQLRQGGNGRFRRRADLAQRPGGVGPHLRRVVFQQFHQRGNGLGGLRAAAPNWSIACSRTDSSDDFRLPISAATEPRLPARRGRPARGIPTRSRTRPSFSDSCSDSYGKNVAYSSSVFDAA